MSSSEYSRGKLLERGNQLTPSFFGPSITHCGGIVIVSRWMSKGLEGEVEPRIAEFKYVLCKAHEVEIILKQASLACGFATGGLIIRFINFG